MFFGALLMISEGIHHTELLQIAVAQSFNAVVITTASLDNSGPLITYCNEAFCLMTGYAEDELLWQSPRILQGPLTNRTLLQKLRVCLQNGTFFQGSTFNYRKDGSSYLVEWNISPVRDEQGTIQAFVSVQQDITQRVQGQQRQALLARALDATQDAVLIADDQENIVFVNQAFERLTGYCSAEVLGGTPHHFQIDPYSTFSSQLHSVLASGDGYQATVANRHKSGHLYYVAQTITPLKDESGNIQHYVSVSKDVSEMVVRTQELRKQANHDTLTGLFNRRAGKKKLQHCDQMAQTALQGYALILADIDEFKRINDCFGHEKGDVILLKFATLLNASVRCDDMVVRWGGEEFLIVLPNSTAETAYHLAERIRKVITESSFPDVGAVTLSLGVAVWKPGDNSASLLHSADQALYQAKQNGRNQVVLAAPSIT